MSIGQSVYRTVLSSWISECVCRFAPALLIRQLAKSYDFSTICSGAPQPQYLRVPIFIIVVAVNKTGTGNCNPDTISTSPIATIRLVLSPNDGLSIFAHRFHHRFQHHPQRQYQCRVVRQHLHQHLREFWCLTILAVQMQIAFWLKW